MVCFFATRQQPMSLLCAYDVLFRNVTDYLWGAAKGKWELTVCGQARQYRHRLVIVSIESNWGSSPLFMLFG
jgi:hypothetical protein